MRIFSMICILLFFITSLVAQKTVAHRGFSSEFPENSLESINAAINNNFNAIELDVQLTRDNVIVLLHDNNIERTSNSSGLIKDFSYQELKKVNFNYASKFEQKFDFVSIPTLLESLNLIKKTNLELILDIKTPFMEQHLDKVIRESQYPVDKLKFIAYTFEQAMNLKRLFFNCTIFLTVTNFEKFHPHYFSFLNHNSINALSIDNQIKSEEFHFKTIKKLNFDIAFFNIADFSKINNSEYLNDNSYLFSDKPITISSNLYLNSVSSSNTTLVESKLLTIQNHLYFFNQTNEKISQLILFSFNGSSVFNANINSTILNFPLYGLKQGVYYVKMTTNKKIYQTKFLVH